MKGQGIVLLLAVSLACDQGTVSDYSGSFSTTGGFEKFGDGDESIYSKVGRIVNINSLFQVETVGSKTR